MMIAGMAVSRGIGGLDLHMKGKVKVFFAPARERAALPSDE
jgi:hypothetical protein